VERIGEAAWKRLRAVRLAALAESPDAFGTTHATCSAWLAEQWREQLRLLTTFVAVLEDRDVGMVRAVEHASSPEGAYLISMWVAPQSRRGGIGRALVEAVFDWARSEKRTRLFLDVREHRADAVAFYETLGFRPTGVVTPDGDHVERQYWITPR
jgi:GNAT superfamily N-acetyltransferase